MQEGLVIKGIGSFYYVEVEGEVRECRARGRLRLENISPMVGDRVKIELEDETWAITEILPRKSFIIRPAIANIDQVLVVVASASPNTSLIQTDKLLCTLHSKQLNIVICINKIDLSYENAQKIEKIYSKAGYKTACVSAYEKEGIDKIKEILKDKISALAGSSGVGKSSIINALNVGYELTTNKVGKNQRGRHTTTHTQLLKLPFGGYIADTPGFSTVDIQSIPIEELQYLFPEFKEFLGQCKFSGCSHTKEPDCAIKENITTGNIQKTRYESYLEFYNHLQTIREW